MLVKIVVLKNFASFIGKQLCWSLFLIKMQVQVCKFIKKDTNTFVFMWNVENFLRTPPVAMVIHLLQN